MLADWTAVKNLLVGRSLSPQSTVIGSNYWIKAKDQIFEIECIIPTDTSNPDTADFVTNFLPNANKPPVATVEGIVTTQFEMKDKTLKLFSASGDVGGDGTVTLLIKVPGTPGSDGRWLSSGQAFFDTADPGDKILGVWFVDHDNISGAGADTVIGSYTDDVAPAENQGWFIPPKWGFVEAETLGFYGYAPSGFYIKLVGKKGSGKTSGTLYINFEWGITG